MNARHLFLSTLSIGTLAITSALTATPAQANPSFITPQPINLHSVSHASPATIAFQNNSNCDIQVLLTDTQEVRYLAPGQTAHFFEAAVGSNPNFRVFNASNGSSLRTISLWAVPNFTSVPFSL